MIRASITTPGGKFGGCLCSLLLALVACDSSREDRPDPELARGVRTANIGNHRGVLFLPESGIDFGPYPRWSPSDEDLASVEAGLDSFLHDDPNWPISEPEQYFRQYWGIYNGGQAIRIRLNCEEWDGWTEGVRHVLDDHQCYPEVLCFVDGGRCFRVN